MYNSLLRPNKGPGRAFRTSAFFILLLCLFPLFAMADPEGLGCLPVVSARFSTDCLSVTTYSTKDLSNVVLDFCEGGVQKIDGLKGHSGTFYGTGKYADKTICGVWIKSGCNKSGDGPGYGEYVTNPGGGSCDQDCPKAIIGDGCDDGDPETVADTINEDCECRGECPYLETNDILVLEVCAGEYFWPTARTNAFGSFFTELEWVAFAAPQENPYLSTDPVLFFSAVDITANDIDIAGHLEIPEEYVGRTLYIYVCLKPAPSNPVDCAPFVEYVVDVLDCIDYSAESSQEDPAVREAERKKLAEKTKLFQNRPNPFSEQTVIGFELPVAGRTEISLTDLQGKLLKKISADHSEGYHEVSIRRDQLPAGLVIYRLKTDYHTLTGKMMINH